MIGTYVNCRPGDVRIGGYLGGRLDACVERSVKPTDGMYLVSPFRSKKETRTWQTEFWGKWMLSAVPLAGYTGDAGLRENIAESVRGLLETQRADGYIGNYTDEAQINGPWDVWGRKYTMLGLMQYHELTGDAAILDAARRVADHLMTQVGPGRKDIFRIGNYHGMASCSVLEPVVGLYVRTGDPKYLDFAKYVAEQMNEPAESAGLISKALAGIDVGSRFPHPRSWWTPENGMKAYEMMSCYQGLLELYRVTGERSYLDATVATARNIMDTEINAAGSGAAFECWYHGAARETDPAYHMMETCVTTTWMRLCQSLLRCTGDSVYADQLELTLYNAYLAALSRESATFSKYCPLEGMRGRGEDQCGMTTNCCIANGPRGFVALLESVLMADSTGVLVNLYTDSTATVNVPGVGVKVTVRQETEYPAGDTVRLVVTPETAAEFTLKLRIPAWSAATEVSVNGTVLEGVKAGGYFPVSRLWKAGDTVTLRLDLNGRLACRNNHFMIRRGPVALARDARFGDGNIHEVSECPVQGKVVELTAVAPVDSSMWMAFTADLRVGLNLETEEGKKPRPVHFCDFASAGNTWKEDSLYRLWQRVPLNVTQQPYVSYNV